MSILITILVVFIIITVLCLMSLAGWILKPIEYILTAFFDGINNCVVCFFRFIAYIILILLFLAMLAG